MKNIFWIIAAAFAFVACSDDDGPREKPFDGEVVSFEASEHLLDAMTGNDVKLGPVTMSLMGMGDYTYANAFCAKQYAVEADFDIIRICLLAGDWGWTNVKADDEGIGCLCQGHI